MRWHVSRIGLWCNGNTADSGPAFPGSSPGSPTVSVRVVPLGATRFFVPLRKLPCGVAAKRVKQGQRIFPVGVAIFKNKELPGCT